MTVQTVKLGKQEFILVAKRDYERLCAQAEQKNQQDAGDIAEVKRRKSRGSSKPYPDLKNRLDAAEGEECIRRLNDPREKRIPWDQVKKRAGLK